MATRVNNNGRGVPNPKASAAFVATDTRIAAWTRCVRESTLANRYNLLAGPLPTAMAFAPGCRLGSYEIVALIGEGGMGVVYRARDVRLERDVALKVLRTDLAATADAVARLKREAKVLAALSHPNILSIHDVGQEGETFYLVTELLAGETLRARLTRGRLHWTHALGIGAAVSDALSAAHARGVAHRDLKPENIFLIVDGRTKVLDFGLAAALQPGDNAAANSRSTMTALTERGVVMGTVDYMSPEQADGRPLDTRTDIFSLGAVLYEMIAGRPAFQRDSRIATLAAICYETPTGLNKLVQGVLPEVERIISRCLRKDRAYRFQHVDDLKVQLLELNEQFRSVNGAARDRATASTGSWRRGLLLMIAATAMAAAGAALWRYLPQERAAPLMLSRLTADPGLSFDPALSRDGRLLAYASDRGGEGHLDIWVLQVGGDRPVRVTQDPGDEREPAFSPDGTRIAFRSERDGALYVVSTLGGIPRKVASDGRRPQFSPDGSRIVYWKGHVGGAQLTRGNSTVYVVATTGGEPQQLQSDFAAAAYPMWTPDGRHVIFLGNRDEALPIEQSLDWWVTSAFERTQGVIKTGALEVTRKHDLYGPFVSYPWALIPSAFTPDGDRIVFSSRSGDSTNLWALPIASQPWRPIGTPERLTSGTFLEEQPSVAPTATGMAIAFASLVANIDIWSLPVNANGAKPVGSPQQVTQHPADEIQPTLSSDGGRLLFLSNRSGPGYDVWIKDLPTGDESPLTVTSATRFGPKFSPDGSKASFFVFEREAWNLFVVPTAGGEPERIAEDCPSGNWSSTGRSIMCFPEVGRRLEILDLSDGRRTVVATHPRSRLFQPHFSHDGQWLAFIAVEGPLSRVYVAGLGGTTPVKESDWVRLTDDETWEDKPRWSPEDSLLYFVSHRDGFRCIWAHRLDATTKRPSGTPIAVYHSHTAQRSMMNMDIAHLEISLSSEALVFNAGELTGNIWMGKIGSAQ